MCVQDVEYNSHTFTKLESDLVRASSDLGSYEKEVKDRHGQTRPNGEDATCKVVECSNTEIATIDCRHLQSICKSWMSPAPTCRHG